MPSTNGHGSKSRATERVALYLRVSSEEQREAGTIQTQRAELDGYSGRMGFEVVGVYEDDGVSGMIPLHERPAGRRLLEDAKARKFDTVLIYRLDRLGRTQLGILDAQHRLEHMGIALRSATEYYETVSPQGRLMFQILGSFSEFEKSSITRRTTDGLYRAHRNGRHLAPVPYGYRANEDGHLEIVAEEAEVVRQVISNIANGATLYSEAARLNALGIRPPSSKYEPGKKRYVAKSWSAPTLRGIVRQGAYSGKRTVKLASGEVVEQSVPAIASSELQQRAVERLEENRRYSGGRPHRNYLLRGLATCEVCGSSCVGRSHPRHGKPYYYYKCGDDHPARGHRAPRGHAPYVRAEWLEETVWSDVRQFLRNPGEVLERIRQQRESDEDTAQLEERKATLSKQLAALQRERADYIRQRAQGIIESDEELAQFLADVRTRTDTARLVLEGVQADLDRKHEEIALAETTEAWLKRLAERIEEVEEDTEEALEKRRELIRLLTERIDVGRNEDGNTQVRITYRFAESPEPVDEADEAVYGVDDASAFRATSAFCSAAKWASLPSSGCSAAPRRSSESISTTSSSQEVGTNAVARAYSRALPP
jgi:site-specific DNA recombinase